MSSQYKRVTGSSAVAKLLKENGFKWKYGGAIDSVSRHFIDKVSIAPATKTITVVYKHKQKSALSKTIAKYSSIQIPNDLDKLTIFVNTKAKEMEDYRKISK